MDLRRITEAAHIPYANYIPGFDVLEISCPTRAAVEAVAGALEDLARDLRAAKPQTYAEAYARYLGSSEWRARRSSAIFRADYRCQICNTKEHQLEVHHRTYERVGAELTTDLIVLCDDCHEKFHEKIAS